LITLARLERPSTQPCRTWTLCRITNALEQQADPLTQWAMRNRSHTSMNELPRRQPLLDRRPDASLLAIAKKLSSRGLNVRTTSHGREVTELSVNHPKHTGTSRVVLGYEGWLIWECDCLIDTLAQAEKTAKLIACLLTHAASQSNTPGTSG
jgi:hypothetical protein